LEHELQRDLKLPKARLHAFQHGRVSVLQAMGVPGDSVMEWVGHFRKHIASQVALYHRQSWQENCGMVPMVPILWKQSLQLEQFAWVVID
jgi:hypothetical protein